MSSMQQTSTNTQLIKDQGNRSNSATQMKAAEVKP